MPNPGEGLRPGPGGVEAEETAPPGTCQAPGGVQNAIAEALGTGFGEVAVQAQGLCPGHEVLGQQHDKGPGRVEANLWPGMCASPVALASLMRSSTWAWPRWRASR